MREVNLNGVYYKIIGDVVKRTISPWKAKVTSGGLEYSDFSQAELEEYHDFRNGIGKKRGVGSDARLDWSEGIDFTEEGQAVLSSLVTTAGSFGVAPVKIIDFQSGTYAIGNGLIAKWNTGTSAWDRIGALLEDCEDAWTSADASCTCATEGTIKKVGTYSAKFTLAGVPNDTLLAYEAITEINLSGYTKINMLIYSTENVASGKYKLLLDDTAGCGSPVETIDLPALTADTWTPVSLTLANPGSDTAVVCIGLKGGTDPTATILYFDQIVADGYMASPIDAKVATDATDSYLVISSAEVAMYFDGTSWAYLLGCQGYLAFYDTKLHSIDTDGNTLRSSAANDIDGTWTNFSLSGDFGTVYDLFEGKLLADGTPTLYMLGTEGLFTIDITNEVAYKQEVAYPPLSYAGHAGMYWNANVWLATGYGILKVSPSLATHIGPNQDDGLPSGYQGYIYDMVAVNNWLVYCVNGGTTDRSSILKRNSSYGGNLQVYTTSAVNKPIACMWHSPSSLYTNGRLWFGEGTDVKYMMFPDTTSNVKQIATYTYVDDSGYGKFPIFRKLAAINKVALGVAAITKSCDTNEYVELFYGLNGAVPTTSLGTYKSSPRPTILTFGSGLGAEFYTIQFAIKLYRGTTTTNSPELESLMFYYYAVPARISSWTFNVEAIGEEGQDKFIAFEAILDTATLVAFYPSGDTNKTSYNVKLTSMPSREWWENQGGREGKFQVTVSEIFNG